MLMIGDAAYTLQDLIKIGVLGYGIIWCVVLVVVALVSPDTVDD